MSFGKAFGVGFLIFVILNLVITMAVSFLVGGNIMSLFTDINGISVALLGGALLPPTITLLVIYISIMMGSMGGGNIGIGLLIQALGFFIVPLITSIIVGRLSGGSKVVAFFAWFLISVISAAVIGIIAVNALSSTLGMASALIPPGMILMIIIIFGVINGIFYGAFAELASGSEY